VRGRLAAGKRSGAQVTVPPLRRGRAARANEAPGAADRAPISQIGVWRRPRALLRRGLRQ
jgi:hypothetical protein